MWAEWTGSQCWCKKLIDSWPTLTSSKRPLTPPTKVVIATQTNKRDSNLNNLVTKSVLYQHWVWTLLPMLQRRSKLKMILEYRTPTYRWKTVPRYHNLRRASHEKIRIIKREAPESKYQVCIMQWSMTILTSWIENPLRLPQTAEGRKWTLSSMGCEETRLLWPQWVKISWSMDKYLLHQEENKAFRKTKDCRLSRIKVRPLCLIINSKMLKRRNRELHLS